MPRHDRAADAVACIQPGNRVFVHGGAATPSVLLQGFASGADRLKDVELIHLHTEGFHPLAGKSGGTAFRAASLFVGPNLRKDLDYDRVDYLPCFLSEIPALLRSGRRPIDVALLQVSPPDEHGYCTLGTSVDVARAAVDAARVLVAQVNPRMPRVHGDGFVHLDEIDHWVETEAPLHEPGTHASSAEEKAIGAHIAALIADGACLQVGIGAIPDAVLAALKGHRRLGVHTEMWSDGVLELLKCGAVDNSRKKVHAGKTVSGFIIGSRAVYDFIDDNPSVIQLGVDYVNHPAVIARNPNVVAINSAVEVDLTGQVCADSVGNRVISGVGGQMDFIRGAALSEGGKPVIALTSRTRAGTPRIVANLRPGAGVVTTRAHVHWVATEFGVADLHGLTLGERARALIALAHPDDRERLSREWKALRS
ncbi:MAG: acetyl-CoA hydrolase/transferase family protein [Bdellovibrionales bacterium]|nr:acetyl-CoA hydrolase/transferase family protein [Bdellovibrionales bacterium]